MENKDFDNSIKAYVNASKNGARKDLNRFEIKKHKELNKTSKKRYVLSAIACAFIIAISLSVFLPIYFNKPSGENNPISQVEDEKRFFDQDEISLPKETTIEEINKVLKINVVEINIGICLGMNSYVTKVDNSEIIYFDSTYFVMPDENPNINQIKLYGFLKNNTLKELQMYDNFEDCIIVKGVKYYYNKYDFNNTKSKIMFKKDNIKYCVEVDSVEPEKIENLIKILFN